MKSNNIVAMQLKIKIILLLSSFSVGDKVVKTVIPDVFSGIVNAG